MVWRLLDPFHSSQNDPVIMRALGLILSGMFLLAFAALMLTPKTRSTS